MGAMSPALFGLLSSLVEERAGLHYSAREAELFDAKVSTRASEAGFESALDYYYFLRYDAAGEAELRALVEALVVGETYLFRELGTLTAAVEHILAPSVAARGRAKVWSAGCSSGEEPFGLAMLLADAGLLERVDLFASDISGRALERARAGRLGARSLRALAKGSPHQIPASVHRLAERWITLPNGRESGEAQVSPLLVEQIRFRKESILKPGDPPLDDLDLILCRNVLIYFRDDVVRGAIRDMSARLRVGGRLAVGASESLMRFGTFLRCEERAGSFFYVKDSP